MAIRKESLGEATWGERLLLARRRSGVSYEDAAQLVSHFIPVSYGSLIRLEKRVSAPTDRKRRMVAYLTIVVYGYEPEEFGLGAEDLPRWITPEALEDVRSEYAGQKADLGIAKKPCNALSAA